MRAECSLDFVPTPAGRFRVKLTQMKFEGTSFSGIEESQPRIIIVRVPHNRVLVTLCLSDGSSQKWGSIPTRFGDLTIVGPDQTIHARTDRPCHWGVIWLPITDYIRYGAVLTEEVATLSDKVRVWRPSVALHRQLRQLVTTAIRAAHVQAEALMAKWASHGLEQQLLHGLFDCLSGQPAQTETAAQLARRELMGRIERLVGTEPGGGIGAAHVAAALGVSASVLRYCCDDVIGMSLRNYLELRQMKLVHRDLHGAGWGTLSVTEVARRHGFHDFARFATAYRTLFNEAPALTMRQQRQRMRAPATNRR